MSGELWKVGVSGRDARPDGTIRHSQISSTFGPGALVDFVGRRRDHRRARPGGHEAQIVEDRLLAMLDRPAGLREREAVRARRRRRRGSWTTRPEVDQGVPLPRVVRLPERELLGRRRSAPRRTAARPRRLLRISAARRRRAQVQGRQGQGQQGPARSASRAPAGTATSTTSTGSASSIASTRRDCTAQRAVDGRGRRQRRPRRRPRPLQRLRRRPRMSVAAQRSRRRADAGHLRGKRPWLGTGHDESCGEPMRLLLRSASNAYFPVMASVIHIPDPDARAARRVDVGLRAHQERRRPRRLIDMLARCRSP